MGEKPCSRDAVLEEIQELPPSAKLVFKTLEYEGDLTHKELTEQSLLPSRTVRKATNQLEEKGVITSRLSFIDARQPVYSLVSALQQEQEDPDQNQL